MRVLVLGAGGPAGVNTCKALAGHDVIALDENPDHLVWAAPYAQETHAAEITVETVNELSCDVVIPQPDRLTMWLADHRDDIDAAVFLPDRRTIALCQDKFETGLAWRRANLRLDRITLIDSALHHYHAELWKEYGVPFKKPCWVRARRGAGAKAAIRATYWSELENWVEFWQGRDDFDMLVEGYLPGRDLAWSSIWYEGDLVCSFTRERLEYIYPGLTPEGLTGTPTRARIVHDDAVNLLGPETVYAVDENPHGIFSVDFREDDDGVPRPTEINAGRGFTTFGLWAKESEVNLLHICVGLALGPTLFGDEPFYPLAKFDCLREGLELVRHIDCGSYIYTPVAA